MAAGKIGKAHYTKSQCLMKIADGGARYTRLIPVAIPADGRVLDPAVSSPRVATVAGRIVTRRSGIQIALLAVLPIFSPRDKRGISVTSGQVTRVCA